MLIAPNWGKPHHPGWYYNLRAHPRAQISYQNETRTYCARLATREEYARYWQAALDVYPGYSAYKTRAGKRQIQMFVLSPAA